MRGEIIETVLNRSNNQRSLARAGAAKAFGRKSRSKAASNSKS
jgi:hypothetical protein